MVQPQGHEAADEAQQRRPKPIGDLPEGFKIDYVCGGCRNGVAHRPKGDDDDQGDYDGKFGWAHDRFHGSSLAHPHRKGAETAGKMAENRSVS
jgi:hypothetical protein